MAISLKKKYNDKNGLLLTYMNLIDCYIAQNKVDEAINYCHTGLNLSKYEESANNKALFYKYLSDLYKLKNDNKNEEYYLILYTQINDSIKQYQDSLVIQSVLKNTDSLDFKNDDIDTANNVESNLDLIIIFSIIGILIFILVVILFYKNRKLS